MPSVPDARLIALTSAAATLLRALVTAAVSCLIIGLAGGALFPHASWPRALVLAGTGIVVAAPLATLARIAWGAPTRRVAMLAVAGLVITAVGALLAR